ncbi:glycosyltransferase family 2 protein [Dyadobacter sp. NIV53]|uniref:glycosyltransferase n=1 Tax=Dyadobacter sp. NIV53 TaxID=2861765 RepID=UPI001C883897|nr:glycosyltransferase [Dyadobacter sp. NIV53]
MPEHHLFSWLLPFIWFLLVSYAIFTVGLTVLWSKLKTQYPGQSETSTFITVIIPVRNEEENILSLLSDINKQTFPKDQFEVLVMNDSSTDNTEAIVNQCIKSLKINIRLINLPNFNRFFHQ